MFWGSDLEAELIAKVILDNINTLSIPLQFWSYGNSNESSYCYFSPLNLINKLKIYAVLNEIAFF